MRAYLIWNPLAGQRDVRGPLEEAIELLEAAGWSIRLCETVQPGDGTRLAQRAVAEGADVVLACGGDGTVSELVNGVAGSDVALGVLPTGTGNVWAKELGIPGWLPALRNPLREAALGLIEARVRYVDIGRANGRHFLLWTGIGFDAQVAHEVEPLIEIRHRLGNVLYVVSGLSLAMSFVGTRSTLILDGQAMRRRVVMVVIANVKLYGGGLFRLAPDACVDDGYLDVYVFRGQGTAATFKHFVYLLTQYRWPDPQMSYHRVRRIEIRTDRPMAVHLDGEAAGRTPLYVEVVPRALKVLVPPTAPETLFRSTEAQRCV